MLPQEHSPGNRGCASFTTPIASRAHFVRHRQIERRTLHHRLCPVLARITRHRSLLALHELRSIAFADLRS
jgi:hypothetical protein